MIHSFFQNIDDSASWSCNRTDGQDLLSKWLTDYPENSSMVTDVTELNNVNAAATDRILGLFARGDMSFEDKRDTLIEPSLSQMVVKAIEVYLEEYQAKLDKFGTFPNCRF